MGRMPSSLALVDAPVRAVLSETEGIAGAVMISLCPFSASWSLCPGSFWYKGRIAFPAARALYALILRIEFRHETDASQSPCLYWYPGNHLIVPVPAPEG